MRGIPVSASVQERVTSCADLDRLTVWFDRALTAGAAEDLFTGDPEISEDGPGDA